MNILSTWANSCLVSQGLLGGVLLGFAKYFCVMLNIFLSGDRLFRFTCWLFWRCWSQLDRGTGWCQSRAWIWIWIVVNIAIRIFQINQLRSQLAFLVKRCDKTRLLMLISYIWILFWSLIHGVHDWSQKKTNDRDIDAGSGAGWGRGGYAWISDTSRSTVSREQYSCNYDYN